MKQLLFLLLLTLVFQSCEDCTITELEDPNAFDCPELMLNVGAACDDNNPDTENDAVDANCKCVGQPVNNCTGILYTSRATVENNNISGWFFDSAQKIPGSPFTFNNIEEKMNGFLDPNGGVIADFSAFDRINGNYVFAYQYYSGTPVPLYFAETEPFNASYLLQEPPYAAPVFLNRTLYAIDVQFEAPNAAYTIYEIDQSTGVPTALFADNLLVNSPLINPAISSASDQSGIVYFLCATNLMAYDPVANSLTYVDIDPGYEADNQVVYSGLEYQQDENRLLAIRSKLNSPETIAELVSISTDGNYQVNTVFDIKNNLGPDNDGQIEFAYHSTTFSQCDNTYYIAEIKELEADPVESFLIEINLNNNTLRETLFPDYLYGLELFEN